jgi:hypothetical protein
LSVQVRPNSSQPDAISNQNHKYQQRKSKIKNQKSKISPLTLSHVSYRQSLADKEAKSLQSLAGDCRQPVDETGEFSQLVAQS